jgi:hypothetical protein
MAHRSEIEALNNTLQDLRKNNRLMGGLTVFFSGDFRQTLPVIPRGTRADEIRACLKSLALWSLFKIISLKTNMRVQVTGDSRAGLFAETLRELGDGVYPGMDSHHTAARTMQSSRHRYRAH